ncbi:MAG: FAD-dependent oxidoreductase [Pseudomonadota bacterium]
MTDVVIVGAGMAGIACARALKAAGVPVRLIDKGRGIGGRVATRRVDIAGDVISFDHGTQYLDTSDAAAHIAAQAKDATARWDMGGGKSRIVGTPGMSALPKALAQGLDVTLDTRVISVDARTGGWHIQTDAGEDDASHLVITVPVPQLAPLLGERHPLIDRVKAARMLPIMTLMAAFDGDTPAPFVTRRDETADLTWIARNDLKPGRSTRYQTWIAQAHPDWSARHIDQERDKIKARMAGMLCAALDVDVGNVRHVGLQGWRYGLVQTPIGQPFVSDGTLWAGGDWCLGGKVQDAWQSGTAIASDILQQLGLPAERPGG